ncbi:hypothetical protein [Variovorax boronicumulans]|uniref:hypothetical protein n=1 Tax=Variovorax boronicumulans TaxID=436515 RepID=UPI0012E6C129|nr:hypothetical protein [Variovorax boronicumulans]GER20123.1 hypothetical protein VCH24_51600 [Variovorax boronicumulans]
MQQSNAVIELDALLTKSDPDSMNWCEYAYEDGEELLSRLNAEDRAVLFRSAKTKPASWRGCLVSILHPSKVDESEVLIGALSDMDANVVGEALLRLYFFCGFNRSAILKRSAPRPLTRLKQLPRLARQFRRKPKQVVQLPGAFAAAPINVFPVADPQQGFELGECVFEEVRRVFVGASGGGYRRARPGYSLGSHFCAFLPR